MGRTTYFSRAGVALLLAAMPAALVPVAANAEVDVASSPETVTEPEEQPTPNPEPEATAPPVPAPPAPRKIYFTPVRRINVKKKLVFPVVGVTKYWSGFGDCRDRCKREHFGIDILTYGWKGLPVVAAHDGTVTKVTFDKGIAGCSLRIRGRDRWTTKYVHLNTDVPGTDEPGSTCLAPGIEVGAKVVAGQIIGWIGDSGNAEHGVPNLHFELRSPSGYPVDPYRSLKAARKIEFEWLSADLAETSTALSRANRSQPAAVAIVVASTEAKKLMQSERSSSVFTTPVLVIDRANPRGVTDELKRLGTRRVVLISDEDTYWIQRVVSPHVDMVETASFPKPTRVPTPMVPDGEAVEPPPFNPPDRFATIISGTVDRLYRSYKPTYERFIEEHRSIVLASDTRARTSLGERSRSKPGRYVDRNLLWWATGDGWIGTESIDDVPDFGFAYVTERRATPWTLTFLGSLSEVPAMPLWKSP